MSTAIEIQNEEAPIPSWIVRTVVGTLLTLLLGGGIGWVANTSATDSSQTSNVAVLQAQINQNRLDISEIKESQRRIEDLLITEIRRGK